MGRSAIATARVPLAHLPGPLVRSVRLVVELARGADIRCHGVGDALDQGSKVRKRATR
jgi:hypothetical protein